MRIVLFDLGGFFLPNIGTTLRQFWFHRIPFVFKRILDVLGPWVAGVSSPPRLGFIDHEKHEMFFKGTCPILTPTLLKCNKTAEEGQEGQIIILSHVQGHRGRLKGQKTPLEE